MADGTGTDTVRLSAANQIANASVVTISSSGVLDLNSFSDTIGNLTVTGGGVTTGGGSLTIGTLAMTAGSLATGTGTLNLGGNVTGNANASSATISGKLNLGTAVRTFTIADQASLADDLAISAVISGEAGNGVTKAGAGTLTLSGANTYSGLTTISGGTLAYGVNNAINTGAVTVNGTGAVLALGGYSDSVGTVTLTAGDITGTGNLHSTSGFTMNNAGTTSVSAILDGAVALTKSAAGTLTLSGANTYTGLTTVSAGTLLTTNAAALSGYSNAAKVVFNGGTVGVQVGGSGWTTGEVDTLLTNATKTSGALGVDTTNGNLTQWTAFTTTNLGGTLGLTKLGDNTLTLIQANTYTGLTSISNGTISANKIVVASGDSSLGNASSAVVMGDGTNTGTLSYTGAAADYTRGFSVTAGGGGGALTNTTANLLQMSTGDTAVGSGSTMTFGAAGSGGITLNTSSIISGAGNVAVNSTGTGVVTFSGANTYTGLTVVQTGTLRATTNTSALGTGTATLTLSGGTLELAHTSNVNFARNTTVSGNTTIVSDRTTSSASSITHTLGTLGIGAETLTVDRGSLVTGAGVGGITFGNVALSASGAKFDVSSGAALTLAAVSGNTYGFTVQGDGNTTISGAITTTTGTLTKDGSGTLTLNGTNTFTGTTTIKQGTITVDTSAGDGFANSAGVTFSGTGKFTGNFTGASANRTENLGALTLSAGEATIESIRNTQDVDLTFSSLSARTSGAVGNFVLTGGSATQNQINLTGQAIGFINQGLFFNGANYAAMNAVGTYVKALVYDGTNNTATSNTIVASKHVKLTSSPTSRTGDTLLSMNLAGSGVSYTMSAGTLIVPGIIKSGGGFVSTISGGTGLTTGGSTELVIRTDLAADSLTISSPILTSSTGGLTKSGAGTLTLSASNGYSGTTTINAGTLALSGSGSIASSPVVKVLSGATLNVSAVSGWTVGSNSSDPQTLTGSGAVTGDTTIGSYGTHNAGDGGVGTQTFTNSLTYSDSSIFEWDLASSAQGTRGTGYDAVNLASLGGSATDAVFKVVLGSGSFSEDFWNTARTWSDIFMNGTTAQSFASIFQTANIQWWEGSTNVTSSTGSQGYFTTTGTTLSWTAVPEPTTALAGLLLGAGLLRRRR